MYEELVKRIRGCSYSDPNGCEECRDCPNAENYYECKQKLALQAADAIEELSRIVREYQKFDGFLAAHGMFEQEPMRPIRDDRGQLLYYPSAEPPKEETL